MTLMKQIQRKREENKKLELALRKLAERRDIIQAALETQKEGSEEKRREVIKDLERQKELMGSRERFINKITEGKLQRKGPERHERPPQTQRGVREEEIFGKTDMLKVIEY